MKRRLFLRNAAVGFCALAAGVFGRSVGAHHGWAWATDEEFELTGRITAVKLGNPHGELTLDGETVFQLGYPEQSTLFYPVLLYQQGFRYFNMGYASAMAMLLLGVSLGVTLLILRSSRLWVFYQGARR